MMYDELVKRLRDYSATRKGEIAELTGQAANAIEELVGFVQEAERDRDEYRERLDKANDAIDELQKAVNFHKFNSEFWEDKYNSLADEKWIPVTEEPTLKVGDDGYNIVEQRR